MEQLAPKENSATQEQPLETGSTGGEPDFPEHKKLKEIRPYSQNIHEFMVWLNDKGIQLARYGSFDRLHPVYGVDKLVAEFFEIDLDKLENEKQQMIDMIRRQNAS